MCLEKESMENKYYTPGISEFYVGFEYEELCQINWEKTRIYKVCELEFIADNLEHENGEKIRVKYLDETDLENLNLTKEEYNLEDYPFLRYYQLDPKIKEYNLYKFTTKYTYLQFWFSTDVRNNYCNLIITCFNDKDNLNCHFKGYIKNKSELQKLLKQLGINE